MKRISLPVFLVLISLMIVLSCKKDESTPAKVLSTKEKETLLLTANSWKISSHVENDAAVAIKDCEKDDILTFSSDGIFTHNVGTFICGDETNLSGTWMLSEDGKFITYANTEVDLKISESKLELFLFNFRDDLYTTLTYVPI
jgi:hypothetical protein